MWYGIIIIKINNEDIEVYTEWRGPLHDDSILSWGTWAKVEEVGYKYR